MNRPWRCLVVCFLWAISLGAQTNVVVIPPPPDVPPHPIYFGIDEDADQNRISDILDKHFADYKNGIDIHGRFGITFDENGKPITEAFVFFTRMVTQGDVATFQAAGGVIQNVYANIGYGWFGRMPLEELYHYAAAVGDVMTVIDANRELHIEDPPYDGGTTGGTTGTGTGGGAPQSPDFTYSQTNDVTTAVVIEIDAIADNGSVLIATVEAATEQAAEHSIYIARVSDSGQVVARALVTSAAAGTFQQIHVRTGPSQVQVFWRKSADTNGSFQSITLENDFSFQSSSASTSLPPMESAGASSLVANFTPTQQMEPSPYGVTLQENSGGVTTFAFLPHLVFRITFSPKLIPVGDGMGVLIFDPYEAPLARARVVAFNFRQRPYLEIARSNSGQTQIQIRAFAGRHRLEKLDGTWKEITTVDFHQPVFVADPSRDGVVAMYRTVKVE